MFTEGGIRVPLIACWPGVTPPDTVTDYMVHSVDFYPTCLDIAGNTWLPPKSKHPLDGYSFSDVLRNPDTKRTREPIFYLFPGYLDRRAQPCVVAISNVDAKRYKLFYYYESDLPRDLKKTPISSSSWELYCLTDDQGESKDLIQSRPEVAETLSKEIHAWLNKEQPTWNPKYPIEKATGKAVPPPDFN
jgi:arylsulfatase A-like enzyme